MSDVSQQILREQLQEQLLEERDRVREQLTRLGQGDEASLDFDENFADSGQVTAERGEVEALVASLLDALEDVDRALAKLDSDGYGLCESCGSQIAEARLQAMPTARMCIACASKKR
jgi:RNA polymerase-binding transcription factor DksA